MEELVKLNRRIAAHWLGVLDPDQSAYLEYAAACLGEFRHSAAELARVLSFKRVLIPNSLPVAHLNRQYLRFARLAAKDVVAGNPEMALRLGVNHEQIMFLGSLTNRMVKQLAFAWDGPIIRFSRQAFVKGVALHQYSARHHATAILANQLFSSAR